MGSFETNGIEYFHYMIQGMYDVKRFLSVKATHQLVSPLPQAEHLQQCRFCNTTFIMLRNVVRLSFALQIKGMVLFKR